MKNKTRNTAAHLLAADYVSMIAEKDTTACLQQVKYENKLDSIYDHYEKRVGILFQLVLLTLSLLTYVAFA